MANVFTARILKNTEIESTFTGNGATEDTVHEMLQLLKDSSLFKKNPQKEQNKKDHVDALKKVAETTEKLGANTSRMGGTVNIAHENLKNFVNVLPDVTRLTRSAITDIIGSIVRLDTSLSSLANTVTGMGSASSNFMTSLGSMFGRNTHMISQAVAAVTQVSALFLGTGIERIARYQEINRNLAESSLLMGQGIDSFMNLAETANIPIGEFSRHLTTAAAQLRLFEGGAAAGTKAIAEGINSLKTTQNEYEESMYSRLFSMGYQTEEIVSAMAEYGARAQLAGRQLDSESLAEGTFNYLTNLRELSRITGISVKEARDQMIQDQSNLFVQRQLLQANENVREELTQFIGTVPDGIKVMRDFIMSGNNFNEQSAVLTSQMPTFANAYRRAYRQIESGAMTSEEAMQYLSRTLEGDAEQIQREINRMINVFGVAPSELIQLADTLGPAGKTIKEMVEASKDGGSAFDYTSETLDDVQKALGIMQEKVESAAASIDNTFNEVMRDAAPMVQRFTENLESAVVRITDWVNTNFRRRRTQGSNLDSDRVSYIDDERNLLERLLDGAKRVGAGVTAGAISGLPGGKFGVARGALIGGLSGLIGDQIIEKYNESLTEYKRLLANRNEGDGGVEFWDNVLARHLRIQLEEWQMLSQQMRNDLTDQVRDQFDNIPKDFLDSMIEMNEKNSYALPGHRLLPEDFGISQPEEMPRELFEHIFKEMIEEFMENKLDNPGPQSYLADPELKRLVENTNTELKKVAQGVDKTNTELKTIISRTEQGNRQAGNYYSATA